MAHLMTGMYIPHFGLNSVSHQEMILPDILNRQKVEVVQRIFPILCNWSFF